MQMNGAISSTAGAQSGPRSPKPKTRVLPPAGLTSLDLSQCSIGDAGNLIPLNLDFPGVFQGFSVPCQVWFWGFPGVF